MPPTPLTGIRPNPCATPLWGGPSGHLEDPTPNTGNEPKFCVDVSRKHTPINLPSRHSSFPENDATIAASVDFDLTQQSGATNSRHSLGSSSTKKLVADSDSVVSSLSGTRKLVADHETIVSVEESVSRRKRDRYFYVVQTLKETISPEGLGTES